MKKLFLFKKIFGTTRRQPSNRLDNFSETHTDCTQSVLVDICKKNCENALGRKVKKFLGILVLVLMFFNIVLADSSLPNCKGTDTYKWTNCFGTEKKSIAYDQLYKDKYKDKKVLYQGEYRNGKLYGQGTI